jgi:predicted phosphodiesterase
MVMNYRMLSWSLKGVLLLCILLAGLVACQLSTPAQPTLVSSPTVAPTPVSTSVSVATSTPSPTPVLGDVEGPTPALVLTSTSTPVLSEVEEPTPTATPVLSTDVVLVRGPYLQSVTAQSIIVVWETDRPSPGEVAYGETEAYDSRVADPAVGTRHAVTLTGLAPYTVYQYRVESGGAPLSEGLTFRTAADPSQTAFTFVVFGDTRTQHHVHRTVVDRIVEQAPDFTLHTGDLVEYGSVAREWETFFEIERELMARVPLFPVLGNHEGNDPLYFALFYLPGNEHWYTFDYGNARFACLQIDGIASFGPGSEQYAWLEETLASNTQPWLFVAFHVPPYTSVRDYLEDDVRLPLAPLFERYGVDVVFNGHEHNYERNEVNGVTYVVTGGGGAPLYAMQEREPTQAAYVLAHHFVLVEVGGDHLQATVISSEGEVIDAFERHSR